MWYPVRVTKTRVRVPHRSIVSVDPFYIRMNSVPNVIWTNVKCLGLIFPSRLSLIRPHMKNLKKRWQNILNILSWQKQHGVYKSPHYYAYAEYWYTQNWIMGVLVIAQLDNLIKNDWILFIIVIIIIVFCYFPKISCSELICRNQWSLTWEQMSDTISATLTYD